MSLNDSLTNACAATLLVVAAALRDDLGCVLMQQRPPGKAHAGLWEFPGGKVEAGETPVQALIRELHEELGISVDERDLAPVHFATERQGARSVILLLFTCERWTGTPQPHDAAALRWDLPAALARLPMPPLDVPLVADLIARTDRSGN